MPRLLGMVLRWALVPFLTFLAYAMIKELWHAGRQQGMGVATLGNPLTLCLAGGIGFRVLFRAFMRRMGKDDPLDFIDTLEHELTHAVFGYLTLCPPVSLSASLKSGGEVQLKGSNPLAALAPYFFPLWCWILIMLGLVVQSGLQPSLDRMVFFALGSFYYRLAREFRWRQTDLHLYGILFSCLMVGLFLLIGLGLILRVHGLLPLTWIWSTITQAFYNLISLNLFKRNTQ
jgi:hypothetical protein